MKRKSIIIKNCHDTIKNLKSDKVNQKNEKAKAEYELRKLDKKIKKTEKRLPLASNISSNSNSLVSKLASKSPGLFFK
jgi:hypothetical protein